MCVHPQKVGTTCTVRAGNRCQFEEFQDLGGMTRGFCRQECVRVCTDGEDLQQILEVSSGKSVLSLSRCGGGGIVCGKPD